MPRVQYIEVLFLDYEPCVYVAASHTDTATSALQQGQQCLGIARHVLLRQSCSDPHTNRKHALKYTLTGQATCACMRIQPSTQISPPVQGWHETAEHIPVHVTH
jgi:hypothetical protein